MYNPQIGDLLFNDGSLGFNGIGMIVNMTHLDGRRMEECKEIPEPNDRTYYINWMEQNITTAYPLALVEAFRNQFNMQR